MGRFINADAYASTGQGILGNNMFAYCGNNPVLYSDPTGNYYIDLDLLPNQQAGRNMGEWIAVGFEAIADRFQEVESEKEKAGEMQFNQNPKGGGQLRNSFTLGGLYEIAEYSYTLVNESEHADSFQGNYEGVFVEWALHNAACYIPGINLDRAMHVDLGYTIFDDQNESYRWIMWGVYLWLFPEQYQEDLNTYLDRMGGK